MRMTANVDWSLSSLPFDPRNDELRNGGIMLRLRLRKNEPTGVHSIRHGRDPAVGVAQPVMTAFNAGVDETRPRKRRNDFGAGQAR